MKPAKRAESDYSEDLDFARESDRSRSIFGEDEDETFKSSFCATTLCPLVIRMQTTVDGYWQLFKDEKAESLCMHQPLLQAQPQQKKPQKINKDKFEDVLNQKTNNPVKRNHEFELFNDEFNKDAPLSNLAQLNQKQKKVH